MLSKHRSNMKGRKKFPTEFRFLTDNTSEELNQQRKAAKHEQKKELQEIINTITKHNKELSEKSI